MISGDDRRLFEESLRRATRSRTGAALDRALADLDWPDALADDARVAVSLLFELQGAANATSGALDQVLAGALGQEAAAAVVLPVPGRWHAPGVLRDERLEVHGVVAGGLRGHATALVVARAGESHVALAVDPARLTGRAVTGLDPALDLVEVTAARPGGGGLDPALDLVEVTAAGPGARVLGPVDWRAAVALGQLALGHEMVGASRRMLELACEHAAARVQFGRPIAMFQAVRHRLADTLVAVEAAAAMLDAAWLDRAPQTAAMAKATAGRGARVAARHCQQVLAGIGFTTEHPFHRYARRILVLEQLLGATPALTRELGTEIIESGHLPALLPL